MSIQFTPCYPVLMDCRCDSCVEGYMRPTGYSLMSVPPKYPHKCTACGAEKTFLHTYPYYGFVECGKAVNLTDDTP